ncbi:MAG: septum formation inhibitor Maf [Chloroflexi bacterium]|nr:septum formation inhibitor Maf [Chloroflexota bacterium]
MKKIVLASASPRRKALLEQIGLKFEVEPSEYEEKLVPGLEPHVMAVRLSLSKAKQVSPHHPNSLVMAADTLGVLEGEIIGKPHTSAQARQMLKKLSGKMHLVITGFSVIDTDTANTVSRSVETKVYFRKLTSEEIDAYVKSGEPLDKAGAYAIQGLGAVLVERIEGDYFNVIGLPLCALAESLKEFGVNILSNPAPQDNGRQVYVRKTV